MLENGPERDRKFELLSPTSEAFINGLRNSIYGGVASIAANIMLSQEAGIGLTERIGVSTAIGIGVFKLLDRN
jgi:hypothetical protein